MTNHVQQVRYVYDLVLAFAQLLFKSFNMFAELHNFLLFGIYYNIFIFSSPRNNSGTSPLHAKKVENS